MLQCETFGTLRLCENKVSVDFQICISVPLIKEYNQNHIPFNFVLTLFKGSIRIASYKHASRELWVYKVKFHL